jgi:zeaxanthin glucosyltransferase
MTHFGVICPTGSHLTATFALGDELQQRGHQITFINILDAQARILAANFEFRAIGVAERPIGSDAKILAHRGTLSGISSLKDSLRTAHQDMQIILQEAPQVIRSAGIEALLVDQCSPLGGTVADHLNIPFISLCNALPLNREISIPPMFTAWEYSPTWGAQLKNKLGYTLSSILTKSITRLKTEYRQKWQLPAHTHPNDNYSQLAQLSQQPAEFEFPRAHLPPHFHFTGPYHSPIGREPDTFPWEQLTGQPLVYASMGTIQNRLFPVFETIAAACVGLDVQLVISLGGGMPLESMSTLPGAPLVVRYAPQLALLKRAALTITHAGLNTALESLTYGVPMVAIPIANDQPGVAARIVWSGCGEMISISDLTVARLRSTIRQVMTQDSYKIQVLRLQSAIRNAGGVTQAANVIESAMTTRAPILAASPSDATSP